MFDFSRIKVTFGAQDSFLAPPTPAPAPREPEPGSDPMADPAKLAKIGDQVRERLRANPKAEDLGGDKADLFRVPGFLTPDECRRICEAIDRKVGPSTLFKGTEVNGFRTSSTHYFDREAPETLALEQKIDAVLGLDHSYAETTQGQRYEVGQQFKHHFDYFFESQEYWQTERRRGGQRTWTAMVFLNEPEAGGETDFKELELPIPPETGTLVTWNNMGRDGLPNSNTFHAGTPVIEGSKYVITQWYRQEPWSLSMR